LAKEGFVSVGSSLVYKGPVVSVQEIDALHDDDLVVLFELLPGFRKINWGRQMYHMKARRIIRLLSASCVGANSRASDRPFEALV
jgi:hypothetical protein